MSFFPSIDQCNSECSNSCSSSYSNSCNSACSNNSLSCSDISGTSIANVRVPKFSCMFETPWVVGTNFGYALTENQEVFIEFNYIQAQNKEYFETSVTNASSAPVLMQVNLVGKYKNTNFYFGYRYNFDRLCNIVSIFLDAKLGLVHHSGINGFINSSLTSSILDGSTTPFFRLFKSSTSFSGAGTIGADICLNDCWSFLIRAELIAGWGPNCHNVSIGVTELGSTSLNTGKIGAEILFPISLGLRCKF